MDHLSDHASNIHVEHLSSLESLNSETLESQSGSRPPLKRSKSSPVWSAFEKVVLKNDDGTDQKNDNGTPVMKAECKICKELLVIGGTSGTSHLLRHMERCMNKRSSSVSQPIVGRTPTGGVYYFQFSQIVARQETVRYFVQEDVPFNKIGKPSFRRWIRNSFGPQFNPPCRNTLKNDVIKVFLEEKVGLKELFKSIPGKVCFTSNLWTSNQRLGYMCITAHFITKDWKLNKRIISFPMLPSPHTGKTISDALYGNLLGWDLCDKIGTLTLDNASSNDTAVSLLKNSVCGDNLLARETLHVRCSAHILNLLVKDGLKHVNKSILNVREAVKHVRTSQAKLQSFHESCVILNMKQRTLPIDVPTRWDATYLMLNAAIPYQKVFDHFFLNSDFEYIPSLEDWKNSAVVRDFFKIFYESTKLFSGMQYVTSSSFCYQLSRIIIVLEKYAKNSSFSPMYTDMRTKYDKYWQEVPLALALASCMDPRYKFTILELCVDLNYNYDPIECDSRKLRYRKKLEELFEQYRIRLNTQSSVLNEETTDYIEEDEVSMLLSTRREASLLSLKSDLQRYMEQPTIKANKQFNVLDWWKAEESTYPILAAMARDLLTIPVSTVPSESAFSGSERVINKSRSCLSPVTVEALMCLKDWYKAEEGSQDEDTEDIEELMAVVDL